MSGELKVLKKTQTRTMTRRELARRLFAALAAGVALNSLPLPDALAVTSAGWPDETPAGSAYTPIYLSDEQLSALEKLCEAIVPGSHKARSAEFLDLLISVETAERQQEFTGSLVAMDAEAKQTFQRNVAALKERELLALLEKASAEQSPLYLHFETSKHWAVAAYYSSEMGMRELGWTPDRVFASYPVCTHEESHS